MGRNAGFLTWSNIVDAHPQEISGLIEGLLYNQRLNPLKKARWFISGWYFSRGGQLHVYGEHTSWRFEIQGSWVRTRRILIQPWCCQEKGACSKSARKFFTQDVGTVVGLHDHVILRYLALPQFSHTIYCTWTNTWYWSYSYLCDSSPIVISVLSVTWYFFQQKSNIHQPSRWTGGVPPWGYVELFNNFDVKKTGEISDESSPCEVWERLEKMEFRDELAIIWLMPLHQNLLIRIPTTQHRGLIYIYIYIYIVGSYGLSFAVNWKKDEMLNWEGKGAQGAVCT